MMLNVVRFLFILLYFFSLEANTSERDNIIGEIIYYKVKDEETLYDIARKFDVGIDELIYANIKVNPWLPTEGSEVIIPSMHILPTKPYKGIIINKAELRLYYFPIENDFKQVITFPISIGVPGHETPLGITKVKYMQAHPYWIPPASMQIENPNLINIMPPGPDNPLGNYAIYLEWPGIIIHGTNKPWSIGTYGSHGCIRMYPEDILILFQLVKKGTRVRVTNEPIKIGWLNEKLYLEASPNEEQKDQIDMFNKVIINQGIASIKATINNVAAKNQLKLNWQIIDTILEQYKGIPIIINE